MDIGRVPERVLELCERLIRAGHEAFLVGGGARDLLLGRPVSDWDVATSARPEAVIALFPRAIPTGIRHGTVTVLLDGGHLPVEVTTYRGEGAYSDGRHPDEVHFVRSLDEDLKRRDFTINAMALDPRGLTLYDPLGGEADLSRRLLRAVGCAEERFAEDGLRLMRAVRFAAVLELDVEEATLAAVAKNRARLRRVSVERIRDELLKLLMAPRPSVGLRLMQQTGLLDEVLPELVPAVGLGQNRYHHLDVFSHSLEVLDGVPQDAVLRLAALLHDVGKPQTAEPHPERPGELRFHNHAEVGASLCETIALRLKLSGAERDRLAALVREHAFALSGITPAGLRRMLRRVGDERLPDLLLLKRADIRGKLMVEERLRLLEALQDALAVEQARKPALSTSALAVDGKTLMARLGLRPGPLVGQLLRQLLERVIEEPDLNQPEALLRLAEGLARELGVAPRGDQGS